MERSGLKVNRIKEVNFIFLFPSTRANLAGIIKYMKLASRIISFIVICLLWGCSGQEISVSHTPAATSSSLYIQNKGSDTMVNLALAWAEAYQKENPQISISVTGGGSGTGLTSLANGTVDLANASRAIKEEEIQSAEKAGIKPVEFLVARDAIAVIVNPNNKITHLTLQQISQIYLGKIKNWKELGGDDRPIVRLSRETNSGTHVYFLEAVIRLGDTKNKDIQSPDTLLLPSSEGIISEVSQNPNAIGYDGLGYVTPEVKVLSIARDDQSPYVSPSAATVIDNSYPISRDLFIYSKNQPEGAVKDYLDWILSPESQAIVQQFGFVPVKPIQ
jgi:phosphate transport system substrate-binding protein